MLERLLSTHPVTGGQPVAGEPLATPQSLRAAAGGRTFAGGLCRIHSAESGAQRLKDIDAAAVDDPDLFSFMERILTADQAPPSNA